MERRGTMTCEGKIAIVTGAAGKGMGRSIALTLARGGAAVVVNYRTSGKSAEEIVDHIEGRGGSAVAVQADVFDSEGCGKLVEATVARFGRVDICVIGPGAGWHMEPVEKLDTAAALEDVHREIAPVYHLLPLVLPGMYERRFGRVVAITVQGYGSPAYAYNVAKAARAQALRLAAGGAWRSGVTLNLIAPAAMGEVATLKEAVELCDQGPAWEKRGDITPQDVAEGVAFLCSEAGRFISNCEIPYQNP